jgi:hypothetical protein
MDSLLSRCLSSLSRGSLRGCTPPPCSAQLTAYEGCVEAHRGVAPRTWEGEWCEEERQGYLACREAHTKSSR